MDSLSEELDSHPLSNPTIGGGSAHVYYQLTDQPPSSSELSSDLWGYLRRLQEQWRTEALAIPASWICRAEDTNYIPFGHSIFFAPAMRVLNAGVSLNRLSTEQIQDISSDVLSIKPDFALSNWRHSTITSNPVISPTLEGQIQYSAIRSLELLMYTGTPGVSGRCLSSPLAGTPNFWLTHDFPPTRSLADPQNARKPSPPGSRGFALVYQPNPPLSLLEVLRTTFIPETILHPSLIAAIRVPGDAFDLQGQSYSNLKDRISELGINCLEALNALNSARDAYVQARSEAEKAAIPPVIVFGLLFNDERLLIVANFRLSPTPTSCNQNQKVISVVIDRLDFGVQKSYKDMITSRMQVITALLTLQRHAIRFSSALEHYWSNELSKYAPVFKLLHDDIDGFGEMREAYPDPEHDDGDSDDLEFIGEDTEQRDSQDMSSPPAPPPRMAMVEHEFSEEKRAQIAAYLKTFSPFNWDRIYGRSGWESPSDDVWKVATFTNGKRDAYQLDPSSESVIGMILDEVFDQSLLTCRTPPLHLPENWFMKEMPAIGEQVLFTDIIAHLMQCQWFPENTSRQVAELNIKKVPVDKIAKDDPQYPLPNFFVHQEPQEEKHKLRSALIDSLFLTIAFSDETIYTLHNFLRVFFEDPYCDVFDSETRTGRLPLPILMTVPRLNKDGPDSKLLPLLVALPCHLNTSYPTPGQILDYDNYKRGQLALTHFVEPTLQHLTTLIKCEDLDAGKPVPDWCLIYGLLYDETNISIFAHYPIRKNMAWRYRMVQVIHRTNVLRNPHRTNAIASLVVHLSVLQRQMIKVREHLIPESRNASV
ncbi:hypothetical protein AX16_008444 [Volvariella volvacea WC 439]|nr:hypothetical protein AX16_008444 [Volvariella volvacea WC 439]